MPVGGWLAPRSVQRSAVIDWRLLGGPRIVHEEGRGRSNPCSRLQGIAPGQEAILRVELREDGARFRFSLADADDAQRLFASGRGRLERRP